MTILPVRHRLAVLAVQTDRIRVLLANGSPRNARVLTFPFDAESGWQKPEQLGLSMRAFLKQEKVSARMVEQLALPADWVALRTLLLPPISDESLLPDLVRTSADDLFAHRLDDLAIGYEATSTEDATQVTIISVLRTRLEAIQIFLRAAGLRTTSAFPYAASLARAVCPPDVPGVLVARNGAGVEVAGVRNGRLVWLRGLEDRGDMSVELRRAALSGAVGSGGKLFVVGANGLADATGKAFGQEPVVHQAPEDESMALLAGVTPCPTLNLLAHAKATSALRPLVSRICLAALAVLVLAVWASVSWSAVRSRAELAQAKVKSLESKTKSSMRLQGLLRATAPWRDDRPEVLQAWLGVAELCPDEGRIWLTSFERDNEGQITLTGRARSRQEILDLQAALEAAAGFTDIKSYATRSGTGSNPVESFSVSCRHTEGGAQ